MTAIEAFSIARTSATIGMRVAGIRVATLERKGPPDLFTAWRRSLPVALCYPLLMPLTPLVFIMPCALMISIWMSPQRRAFHDRLSRTVVVQAAAPEMISSADLDTWWQPDQAIVMSPWGRVPDVFERRRARAHRLEGAWWLAAVIMGITILSVGVRTVPLLWVWTTLGWLVLAIADETWWISAQGANPGHRAQGFRVVDITTGQAPSRGRALARAIVVVPMICIPPLQVIAALWVHASTLHRGPHDLIARTVVVEPDYEPVAFVPTPAVLYRPPVPFSYRPPPPPVRGPF